MVDSAPTSQGSPSGTRSTASPSSALTLFAVGGLTPFTTSVVILAAVLAAAGAGKLARLEGATYPAALKQAAIAFTATVTPAAALSAALAGVRS